MILATLLSIGLMVVLLGAISALSGSGKRGHRDSAVLNGPDGRSLRSIRNINGDLSHMTKHRENKAVQPKNMIGASQ